jgi:hypothetical protein
VVLVMLVASLAVVPLMGYLLHSRPGHWVIINIVVDLDSGLKTLTGKAALNKRIDFNH